MATQIRAEQAQFADGWIANVNPLNNHLNK